VGENSAGAADLKNLIVPSLFKSEKQLKGLILSLYQTVVSA